MDWAPYYPAFVAPHEEGLSESGAIRKLTKPVEIADIGCGFGGLLVALAPILPDNLMLGNLVRSKWEFSS
jgi:tRNA (guanine-N7-)-methyltransferase